MVLQAHPLRRKLFCPFSFRKVGRRSAHALIQPCSFVSTNHRIYTSLREGRPERAQCTKFCRASLVKPPTLPRQRFLKVAEIAPHKRVLTRFRGGTPRFLQWLRSLIAMLINGAAGFVTLTASPKF